jgi:hypothetical protein
MQRYFGKVNYNEPNCNANQESNIFCPSTNYPMFVCADYISRLGGKIFNTDMEDDEMNTNQQRRGYGLHAWIENVD